MSDKPKFKNPFVEMARAAQQKQQQHSPHTDTAQQNKPKMPGYTQAFNNKPTARRSGRGR